MGHISPLFSTSAVFSCIVEDRSKGLAGDLSGTAVLPQELEGKLSLRASRERKPDTATGTLCCFVKLVTRLLLHVKPNSNGKLTHIIDSLVGAVNERGNPLPLKSSLWTTAPIGLCSGEATSPAKLPPPGLAHFCTVHGSTALNLFSWEPQAQFERAEGEEALLGASAASKGYTSRQTAPVKVSRGPVESVSVTFSAWHNKGHLCGPSTMWEVMHLVCSSTGSSSPLQPPCVVWICLC